MQTYQLFWFTSRHTGNFELNVVGDFDAAELEHLALAYVGTARAAPAPQPLHMHPIVFRDPPEQERHQTWHLKVGQAAGRGRRAARGRARGVALQRCRGAGGVLCC